MQARIVRHRIVQALTAAAIAASLYTGWVWGDPTRYPKVETVLNAIAIG